MIDHQTVERILDAADVTEVIQEFVTLKKRGVNYLGLCPFHNEKTPSFTVSPSKGIFKCFGCGKGGNPVNFIMEHEHLSYPEALRWLARKYSIEVQEKELTTEEKQRETERESMLVVSAFAARKFSEYLFHTEEGMSVGLSYFSERGFRHDVLKKFEAGYSPEKSDTLTNDAMAAGYKKEYLVKSGLTIDREHRSFDRFYGRIIFPIHSLSGQVLGFGGRILRSDAKAAKYLNSPESEIYHKSKILYGIYQARKTIIKNDKCFITEGYTDVLALHQAGIENVVASSGTALTTEQVRLIKRFTPNITIIFDGDEAGQKASLRGVDIVLEEGMNVRVVTLPPGEDPDSMSHKMSVTEFSGFISDHETDFIRFKTELLLRESDNDPVRRAEAIRDIVRSIAVIPDQINRTIFIKECSTLMGISENILYSEVNKLLGKRLFQDRNRYPEPKDVGGTRAAPQPVKPALTESFYSEREIVRLLLKYGADEYEKRPVPDDDDDTEITVTVAEFIVAEIAADELTFNNKVLGEFFEEFRFHVEQGIFPGDQHFVRNSNPEITKMAVDLLAESYELSKLWLKNGSKVHSERNLLKELSLQTVLKFKSDKIQEMRKVLLKEMNESADNDDMPAVALKQKHISLLDKALKEISKELGGRIVL